MSSKFEFGESFPPEAEFVQIKKSIEEFGFEIFQHHLVNPNDGHYTNWRGEKMVDPRFEPGAKRGALMQRLASWVFGKISVSLLFFRLQ